MDNQLQELLESSARIDTGLFNQVSDCLVIAPHPDDESLGCGGLISKLRKLDITVHVIFTTDGSMSHPHAQNINAAGRTETREQEAISALQILGVEEKYITFFRGKDSALPASGEEGFEELTDQMRKIIEEVQPGLVLVPYEFDPHRDHRASWQMTIAALEDYPETAIWQYLIWLYTLGNAKDVEPLTNIPGGIQYLPMGDFKKMKKNAIAAHQSQFNQIIFNDPDGFFLKEDVLQNFYGDKEYYIKY
jgi:LmbE family N-acetylglucosaminyl deacetylase